VTAAVRSVLVPAPEPLALPILGAVILHVGLVSGLVCAGWVQGLFDTHRPLVDPDQAMEVSMLVLPRTSPVVQRATRAPAQAGESPKAAEPPPIRESDLAIQTESAPQTKGDPKATDLEDQIREMLMRESLMALDDAPLGTENRVNDPSSDSEEMINAAGSGARTDPELARYIASLQKLFNEHFKPLPAIVAANPGLKCQIRVQVNSDTGEVTGYAFVKPSGNPSYDRSAESAVEAVSRIPLPPDKYRGEGNGYVINFP
jgi:hypothetical protein